MKYYVSLLLTVATVLGIAQEKTLTLEDATLGYWKGLYPERLRGLHWADEESHIYSYSIDRETLSFDAESGKKLNLSPPKISKLDDFYKDNKNIENKDAFSKNGKEVVAYTLENNLFIATPENAKIAVTKFEDKNIVSGQAIARSEYGITKGTFWSPNGNLLAFYQKNEKDVKAYPLVDVTTYPATSTPIKYPMAGQGSEIPAVGIYNLENNKTTYLDIDGKDNHYITNLSWSPDEKYILVAEINRATTKYDLNLYDADSGQKVRTILTEENSIWVEPEHDAVFLPNSNTDFIWYSEKDGFMNLYIYNINGTFKKQLTNFEWVVNGILGFDKKGKNVFISGTGEDARESHVFCVNLKNGKYKKLTPQAGTHRAQLSPDGNYLLDRYTSISSAGETQVINTNTGKTRSILKAENPLKDYKVGTQEFVDLNANDGTKLHGIIMKPADFDPNKKYPVLIYVYGGPHAQLVTNSYLGGASMWLPAFATLNDYIVFTLDNRGSANRGFKFESGIHRQLGELEMQDQLVGVEYLKSLPYVDADRMAINGWSFGGFMTTSLMLRHPGTFTTAVAGGPVIDWKYYEVMYGERYMDTPQENPEGYENNRVSKYIKNLDGRLLLITGSVDPVVVPQHSMSLLKTAVDENVQVDFFSYPMHEHNVRGMNRVHLIEKMADYIVEHNK